MFKFAAAMVAMLAALALTTPAAQAQVVLNTNLWLPMNHPLSGGVMMPLCEDIRTVTSGRVRCNVLPKPVVSPTRTFDAVRNGVVDLAYIADGYTPGRFQLSKVAELPFLGNTAEGISVAYQRTYQRYFAQANEHKGVKVLAVLTHGPGQLYTRRPIHSLDDLRGLKIRTGGGMVNDVFKSIGATGMFKAAPEVYELMAGGIIDGFVFPKETVHSLKLIPLFKYCTSFPGGLYNVSLSFVMNEAKWRSIPKPDQAALESLFGEALARRSGKVWDAADKVGEAEMRRAGIRIEVPSPQFVSEVSRRVRHLDEDWIAAARARGVDGAAALKDFREAIASIEAGR